MTVLVDIARLLADAAGGDIFYAVFLLVAAVFVIAGVAVLGYVVPLLVLDEVSGAHNYEPSPEPLAHWPGHQPTTAQWRGQAETGEPPEALAA